MLTGSQDTKIVYRRYASLFFIAGCSSDDNELITLEIIHRYVEQMDKYYGNVCELDIIFSFTKAYYILDELLLAGELQESSKKNVLRCIAQQDSLEDMEVCLTLSYLACNSTRAPLPVLPSARILRIALGADTRRPTARSRMKSRRSCSETKCIHYFFLVPTATATPVVGWQKSRCFFGRSPCS